MKWRIIVTDSCVSAQDNGNRQMTGFDPCTVIFTCTIIIATDYYKFIKQMPTVTATKIDLIYEVNTMYIQRETQTVSYSHTSVTVYSTQL